MSLSIPQTPSQVKRTVRASLAWKVQTQITWKDAGFLLATLGARARWGHLWRVASLPHGQLLLGVLVRHGHKQANAGDATAFAA